MLAAFPLCAPALLPGQQPAAGIQDNSFLMEEAYNQEAGVVQHINVFNHAWRGREWQYAFTQEWPFTGQRHQLSYTILLAHAGAPGSGTTGLGDLALNYRYQLVGDGEPALAIAPRITLLVPTGSASKGLGAGGAGVQLDLPLSLVLSPRLTIHTNAGATLTPSARNAAGDRARTTGVNLGQSLIVNLSPTLNFMVEAVWSRGQTVASPGQTASEDGCLVSPGIRYAFNFRSGLQIVPGIAVPLGVGPSRGEQSVLLYLSFEHPFKR